MDFNELHIQCMAVGLDYETVMSRHSVFDPWRNINEIKYLPALRFHNWNTNKHYEVCEPTWEEVMLRVEKQLPIIAGNLGVTIMEAENE